MLDIVLGVTTQRHIMDSAIHKKLIEVLMETTGHMDCVLV